ncbi:HCN4 [Symbiodinium sp. CCMP2592]|nr:HCN4 [Symbiodinium sp. CCMP2592]
MDSEAVELKVRISDAQGLRLQRGGEIRLVITLCTSLDREGAEFGAKVTPWLPVPPDEAPQWKAREAIFRLLKSRCFEAEFVDSAHLHIALMQKGAEQPEKTTLAGAALGGFSAFKQGGFSALRSHAAASASALPLGGFQNERGDLVGSLNISVGRRLACAEEDGGPIWLQLLDVDGRNVKGQLLVDFPQPPPVPAQTVASPPREKEPQPPRRTEEAPKPTDEPRQRPLEPRQRPFEEPRPAWESRTFQATKPDVEAESSTSEGPMPLPFSPPRVLMSSASSSADGEADAAQLAEALAEQLSQLNLPRAEVAPLEWSSQSDQDTHDTFSSSHGSEVNIFNINDAGRASRAQVLKDQLMRWSKRAAPWRFSQRLHSAFDPEARQGRREVRKWRQRHEVFCLLNEIEQHLNDVVAGLRQADSSMRRFCRSHGSERLLQEASRLPAFLCDAALYYKSEAGVPGKLEDKLCKLERVADDFRAISIEPPDVAPEQSGDGSQDPGEAEDLQIDIAVLLESTLMAASQALGEYKKMHCRLELVATEYEPLCRLELSNATRPATFLPLLAEDAAVTLPDQAIVWAQDFSQLVDQASQTLATLVRELASRKQIFTMLAMIVGGAFYGYVVGNISVILASNDVNWRAQKERLELIEAWLTHHRFPTQLRRRIWAYYKQTVNSQVCWDDATVFYELSSELREDVASFLIHPVLPRNLIFRGVPTSAMIRLVGILQQVTAKKRERIVPSDKFVMGMFLILDGGAVFEKELEDMVADGSEATGEGRKKLTELLRNGDSFGEEVLLGLKNEYEYTVTASRKLVLLFVPRDRFIERLANMPEVFGIMRANFVG